MKVLAQDFSIFLNICKITDLGESLHYIAESKIGEKRKMLSVNYCKKCSQSKGSYVQLLKSQNNQTRGHITFLTLYVLTWDGFDYIKGSQVIISK